MMQAMRAMQVDATNSPQASTFHRNIQSHSTPLNGANSSNRTNNSNKKRRKKRKLIDSDPDVIDLTPKKHKVSSNDSDVEIIEPEPPTIIDLVEDETYICDALTTVNAAAGNSADATDATTSNSIENETANSDRTVNNDVSVIVDSSASMEIAGTSEEAPKVIETNHSNVSDQCVEPIPLYVKDLSGGSSIKPPLYDLVSDDSFCFDSPVTTPFSSPFTTPFSSQDLSQNKTLVADDSVIFVSESQRTPRNLRRKLPRADDFISINRGGFNKLVS